MIRSWAMLAGLTLAVSPAVRADTILKGAPGSNPIPQPDVKVVSIVNGTLTYTTPAGGSRTAALTDVQKVTADGQPTFNAAEDAFANRNFQAALDGYTSALGSAGAPAWLKVRAGQRLALVARLQHRYDAEVTAYAALIGPDPATAATARPAAPQPNDPRLDDAAAAVSKGLAAASGSAQKSALLGVQLEIARAKGDKTGVAQTLQLLVAAGGASAENQAMLKLYSAEAAIDARQYAQAESTIQQSRALFTDPGQQVDALFTLAQARDGLAVAGGDGLKDVAIAYLRVVTFGGDLPDKPHVAESLLRAGQIAEKLGDSAAAKTLYQQLSTDPAYARTAAAAQGRTALDRLKK